MRRVNLIVEGRRRQLGRWQGVLVAFSLAVAAAFGFALGVSDAVDGFSFDWGGFIGAIVGVGGAVFISSGQLAIEEKRHRENENEQARRLADTLAAMKKQTADQSAANEALWLAQVRQVQTRAIAVLGYTVHRLVGDHEGGWRSQAIACIDALLQAPLDHTARIASGDLPFLSHRRRQLSDEDARVAFLKGTSLVLDLPGAAAAQFLDLVRRLEGGLADYAASAFIEDGLPRERSQFTMVLQRIRTVAGAARSMIALLSREAKALSGPHFNPAEMMSDWDYMAGELAKLHAALNVFGGSTNPDHDALREAARGMGFPR